MSPQQQQGGGYSILLYEAWLRVRLLSLPPSAAAGNEQQLFPVDHCSHLSSGCTQQAYRRHLNIVCAISDDVAAIPRNTQADSVFLQQSAVTAGATAVETH